MLCGSILVCIHWFVNNTVNFDFTDMIWKFIWQAFSWPYNFIDKQCIQQSAACIRVTHWHSSHTKQHNALNEHTMWMTDYTYPESSLHLVESVQDDDNWKLWHTSPWAKSGSSMGGYFFSKSKATFSINHLKIYSVVPRKVDDVTRINVTIMWSSIRIILIFIHPYLNHMTVVLIND
jgi:hypothetical protein